MSINLLPNFSYPFNKLINKNTKTDDIIFPKEKIEIKAGEVIGLVGEYNIPKQKNNKLLHLETFTKDDVKTFAQKAKEYYENPNTKKEDKPNPTQLKIPKGIKRYIKEEKTIYEVIPTNNYTNLRKAYLDTQNGYKTSKRLNKDIKIQIDESTLNSDRYLVIKIEEAEVKEQGWTVHKDYIEKTNTEITFIETTVEIEDEYIIKLSEIEKRIKDKNDIEYLDTNVESIEPKLYIKYKDCKEIHPISFEWADIIENESEDKVSIFKNIKDIIDIEIQIKLLDKDKKPLSSKPFSDKIPKAERTTTISNIFKKYNSKYNGEYIIKYETTAKEIAEKLNIKETDEKYKKISFLSFKIDANGNHDITDETEWFDVEICQGITREMLNAICPKSGENKKLLDALNKYCCQYKINTPLRIAHFLSQVAHESGCFSQLIEDDDYRESIAIKNSCYKKYRESDIGKKVILLKNSKGIELCKQPEYFNCKYHREDLGNGPDDGHKFRGRGLIQLTGKNNYQEFTNNYKIKNINDNKNFIEYPDLISSNINYAVASACYWWNNLSARGGSVNKYADKGATKKDVYNVSWCVNSRAKQKKPFMTEYTREANGLKDRWEKFEKIAKYLGLIK